MCIVHEKCYKNKIDEIMTHLQYYTTATLMLPNVLLTINTIVNEFSFSLESVI